MDHFRLVTKFVLQKLRNSSKYKCHENITLYHIKDALSGKLQYSNLSFHVWLIPVMNSSHLIEPSLSPFNLTFDDKWDKFHQRRTHQLKNLYTLHTKM